MGEECKKAFKEGKGDSRTNLRGKSENLYKSRDLLECKNSTTSTATTTRKATRNKTGSGIKKFELSDGRR